MRVVEVTDDVQVQCTQLGSGVVYALRVLCAQLVDDPLRGVPGWDPSMYVVHVDGETFWLRIESWLRRHATTTHAALKSGASEAELAALEEVLGVRIPVRLRALWRQCAGSRDVRGAGLFPDHGWALMDLDAVARSYEGHITSQRRWEQQFGAEEGMPLWKSSWFPFCSWSVTDLSHGRFVDGETGETGSWGETAERTVEDESLTMLLEEMADRLEYPKLFPGYEPGLIGGMLVWGPPHAPEERALWEPWSG
ncbi:SMI1/KNR4 family protein [Streptomyces noursei]|uniref:SMI1/KNR4 family protein n=1 Tax=Streptomyces noursei TaxID=1971 RepID=UPI0035D81125